MKSGGGKFSQRSSVSITTSGWRWSKVARLMSLNHISTITITTTTGLISSIAQVHTHAKHWVRARRITYAAKRDMLVISSCILNYQVYHNHLKSWYQQIIALVLMNSFFSMMYLKIHTRRDVSAAQSLFHCC